MSPQKSNIDMLGIIGGSGFYELLENPKEEWVDTRYFAPSDKLMVGQLGGRDVVFLPRHGRGHKIPPHMINYRANLLAMKELGVKKIIAPSAVGSLLRDIAPGTFVVCDSYLDMTRGAREDTFFDHEDVRHMSSVDPYCAGLRKEVVAACRTIGVPAVDSGTLVVINGPRFSTVAESKFFASVGGSIIGMTGYPEVVLANELGICYAAIGLVTDYDAWSATEPDIKPSSAQEIRETFRKNIENVKKVVAEVARTVDLSECPRCKEKVEQSKFN